MGWDKTIPNEDNVVRGVSGDLALVRENFEALDPIVTSGLNGLSGVDTTGAVSGQALTYSGGTWVPATPVQSLSGLEDTAVSGAVSGQALAYQGGGVWGPETISVSGVSGLDDLNDVDTSGAVSGDGLVYDGSSWGPGTVTTSGTTSRAMLALSGDQSFAQDTPTTVTGMQLVANVGNWTVNPASGIIEVPSGISLVEVRAQMVWEFGDGFSERMMRLLVDGSPLASGDVYTSNLSTVGAPLAEQFNSWAIAVSGGEEITLQGLHNQGTAQDVLASGQQTWFEVRAVSGGAGGAGGGSFTADCYVYMPDAPPVSGTAYDDEFNGLTVTGAGGKWTVWDVGSDLQGAASTGQLLKSGGLSMTFAVGNWCGIYMDCTPLNAADFSFTTKIGFTRRGSAADEAWVGLAFFDQLSGNHATAPLRVGGIYSYGGNTEGQIGMYDLSNYADATPSILGVQEVSDWGIMQHGGIYLRMAWDVSVSGMLFSYSMDGVNWGDIGQVNSLWFPTEVAIIGKRISGSGHTVRSQFFRMRDTASRSHVISGAEVAMQYA